MGSVNKKQVSYLPKNNINISELQEFLISFKYMHNLPPVEEADYVDQVCSFSSSNSDYLMLIVRCALLINAG